MTHDELMDAYQVAWSERDPAAFAALCTDDVHYEDPLTPPLTGPLQIGAHAQRLWVGFPDARVEQTGPRMVAGDHVSAPMKLVATHRGELEGLPATGRFLVAQLVVVAERHPDDGRLWRIRSFFDPYGAGVQLGILPEPGSLGGKALLMLRGFGLRSRT
jgi:ketosteroid isomerase-like protein